jgi:hypothetical protein
MMPVAPLSRMREVKGSSQLRTRTKSMKMKSCPVVLATRAMSPERASRTIMPSDTPPARMRVRTGFEMSGMSVVI